MKLDKSVILGAAGVDVPLEDGGKVGFLLERVKATGRVFRETAGDYYHDFHTAPQRQYVVNLGLRRGRPSTGEGPDAGERTHLGRERGKEGAGDG